MRISDFAEPYEQGARRCGLACRLPQGGRETAADGADGYRAAADMGGCAARRLLQRGRARAADGADVAQSGRSQGRRRAQASPAWARARC